jgi:hypothetical protein
MGNRLRQFVSAARALRAKRRLVSIAIVASVVGGTLMAGVASASADTSSIPTAVSVSASDFENCEVLTSGQMACWSPNNWFNVPVAPTVIQNLAPVASVSSGFGHSCALLKTGQIQCWGSNTFGQLGLGSNTAMPTPTGSVGGILNALSVSAGGYHSCAVLTSGAVQCWGYNGSGELGDGSRTASSVPVVVSGLSGAVSVSAGFRHSCAVLADGRVACWGANYSGELGDGSRTGSSVPVIVSGLSGAVSVSAGFSHSCAVLADGRVACWGANDFGQISAGSLSRSAVPRVVPEISEATSVSAGFTHSCARLSTGAVKCWGTNSFGQLGDGSRTRSDVPVSVLGVDDATSVAAGTYQTCAVLASGDVSCWGRQLVTSNFSTTDSLVATSVGKPLWIQGQPHVGATLTAMTTSWDMPSIQWLRSGVPIEGATGNTYVLTAEDAGETISFASGQNPSIRRSTETGLIEGGVFPAQQLEVSAYSYSPNTGSQTIFPWDAAGALIPDATSMRFNSPLTLSSSAFDSKAELIRCPDFSSRVYKFLAGPRQDRSWLAPSPFPTEWLASESVSFASLSDPRELSFNPASFSQSALQEMKSGGGRYFVGIACVDRATDTDREVVNDWKFLAIDVVAGEEIYRVADSSNLYVHNSAPEPRGTSATIQWRRSGIDVPGATGPGYRLGVLDQGQTISAVVRRTKDGYAADSAESTPSLPLTMSYGDLITTSSKPTLSGSNVVGASLSVNPGYWDEGVSFQYQWRRNSVPIPGETNPSLTLTQADAGNRISVTLTGTKPGVENVVQYSEDSETISGGLLQNTSVPRVTGTTRVGSSLAVDPGSWDAGVSFEYQWSRSGIPISGATQSTFTLSEADAGQNMSVSIIGSKPYFIPVSLQSQSTDMITGGTLQQTKVPTIDGSLVVGSTVTAVPGTWDSGVTFAYQWRREGVDIPGATASTYVLREADAALTVSVLVTGSKAGVDLPVSHESAASAMVTGGTLQNTPVPAVQGDVAVGYEVTATPGTWDSGVSFTYAWSRDGVPIPGATSSTYAVTGDDVSHQLTVAVTGSKPGFYPVTVASSAIVPIAKTTAAVNLAVPVMDSVEGYLSLALKDSGTASFDAPQVVNNQSITVGHLPKIEVSDGRVHARLGWDLSATVDDFVNEGDHSITIANRYLGIAPNLVSATSTAVGVDATGVATVSGGTVAGSAVYPATIASAASGFALNSVVLDGTLRLVSPQEKPAGRYNSTLRLTAISK